MVLRRPLYEWPCPKCEAPPMEPCRSLTTGRMTDTHVVRYTRPSGWAA